MSCLIPWTSSANHVCVTIGPQYLGRCHICINHGSEKFQKRFLDMMSENITKTRTKMNKQQVQQENENIREELESITVVYRGKEHKIEFPNNADAKLICQCIKRETGVRGSFYVHFGEQSNNYLHCSSVTRGNLAKLAGKSLEVRGGNGKDVRTCFKT